MTLSVDTILSPQQRAALAADPAVGGGNLLPSAIKANAHPDKPFLHSVRPITNTEGQPQHTFTLLELDQLVQSWSVFYLSKGVQPRDRVAVHIEDSYAYSVHFHALAQIGAIGVLINSRASDFIAKSLLAQTTPVGLYIDRERLAQLGELPEPAWIVVAEDVPAPPAATLADADRFRHVAEDPVVILHSSGTTGVPKPTIHTHESIAAGPKFRLVDHKERPGAVTLTGLPQSHLGCIAYSAYAVLAGANTIAGRDYSGADLIDAVVEHRPTAVMSFAHAYSEIPALTLEPGTVDSVDFWVSIGDAVHEAHIHHLLRQRSADRPEATFLDRLGTTELGWGALLKARTLSTERNDRCAGQPVGVSEVTILRKDGSFADDNEVGLLAAKGPAITPGYWGNSDLTYRFRLGGYWLTGDNAYRDEHGDHFLVDRTVDAIETAKGTGYSVFMEEAILSDVPDIVDIAVIAGRAGATVVPVAVVTVRAEVEAEKLLRLANEALTRAGHLQLGVLEIASGDEDLPVGVTGKVLKRQLREKYTDLATYVSTHTGSAVAVQGQLEPPPPPGKGYLMSNTVMVFDTAVSDEQIQAWQHHFELAGARSTAYRLGSTPVLVAPDVPHDTAVSGWLPRPLREVPLTGEIRLSDRALRPEGTVVRIGQATIGDGTINVFAGPCAVETREQLFASADAVAQCGVVGLRGGAFKPRTSPYSFQGLRWAGLDLLAEARERTGLPIVTEVVEPDHVARVAATADALQIGARNMQNFSLLTAAGQAGIPVVLKRGFGVTIDETLGAAEYLLNQGNDQVILCERGIRTFENATRFTLDLSAVAVFKQRSHLPVMVDPSHAAGIPSLVEPLTLAAAAVGADALLIDVHIRPEQALCDGKQAMLPTDFAQLMGKLEMLAMGVGRKMGNVARADVGELLAQV